MKKVLIVAGIGAVLYFVFRPKTDETQEIEASKDFRELTDAEAKNYLDQNSDLAYKYKGDLEKAKWHWRVQGWVFERDARPNPYLS